METPRPAGADRRSGSGPPRVVVRRRLAEGGLGDVLGSLERWSDGLLLVRTRRGPVEVREVDLVAVKQVPDPPAPRRPRREAGGPGAVGSGEP